MSEHINCLTDCNADCCRKRKNYNIIFDFNESEVSLYEKREIKLIPHKDGGYIMTSDCIFLAGNRCILHGLPQQPECCRDNTAGDELCLKVRRMAASTRWKEVE